MTDPLTTPRSRFARWWRPAAGLLLLAAVLPASIDAARRNRAALRLLHGDASGAAGATDDLLVLRHALFQGDWTTAERMLERTARPDRLAALLVIHEADRRVKAGDLDGGRAALGTIRPDGEYDSVLWYRVGEVYERADRPADAVVAYTRGASRDPAAPWTEGRYRMAMMYQRQGKWQPLADLLALVGTASDEDLARGIESLRFGGAIWQGTLLALGEAYERLGQHAAAEATYERLVRIGAPRRDWTLNRALVYLARSKRSHGDFPSALEAVRRALDLSTEFDASFRREYELDTAGEARRLIDQARRDGRFDPVRASIEDLIRRTPASPGSWFLRGLAHEAACDSGLARSDYAQAATLVRPGSGAFLAGRPIDPPPEPCPAR